MNIFGATTQVVIGVVHWGCALGLRNLPEQSTPFLEAREVSYSRAAPVIGSGIEFLLYGATHDLRRRAVDAICFTKHLKWREEREWRVMTKRRHPPGIQHGGYPFLPEELESVTLGTHASSQLEKDFGRILTTRYPSAKLYRLLSQRGELERRELSLESL